MKFYKQQERYGTIITARQICADYLGCSRAHLSKLVKDKAFPPPSYDAPGQRGVQVWFVGVVELWRAEWLALQRDGATSLAAGTEATKIAQKRSHEIKMQIDTERVRDPRLRERDVEVATVV